MSSAPMDRPDLYVVARLLTALERRGGRLRKTQLQLAAGVNYAVFARYLRYLCGREMLRLVPGTEGEEWVEMGARGHEALRYLTESLQRIVGALEGMSPRRTPASRQRTSSAPATSSSAP